VTRCSCRDLLEGAASRTIPRIAIDDSSKTAGAAQMSTQGEEHYEHAATLAASQGARMVELQALTRLAELRRSTGAEAASVRRLQGVYDAFTEGFDTPPLARAAAMLAR
jgi:hypothetical protein